MGSSSSFQQLAGKLEKAAREIETRSDEEIVGKDALRAKRLIAAQIAVAAPGGTLRSGSRKADGSRSGRVGARYDLAPNKKGAIVRATGPAHLIERDTSPHWIPRQLGGTITHTATGRRRSKASVVRRKANVNKVLKIGNNLVKGPIKHPGTKGKHPFRKGVRQFLPGVSGQLEKNFDRILRRVI